MGTDAEGTVVEPGEGDAWWVAGSLMVLKATGADTHGGMTVIEQTCPPGLDSPAHVHPDEEQCLYVLDGTIVVTVGDVTRTVGAGGFVVMPRGVSHSFVVTSDAGARFLSLTTPAGFERLVAEIGEPAVTLPPPPTVEQGSAVVDRAARLGYDRVDR
jgi:quercetin dioxygenase-like cupin family protein